jgi:hypothetical protein
MDFNDINSKKYIKVCKESGYISAKYNTYMDDVEDIVMPYDYNEISGQIKFSKDKKNSSTR